MKVVLVFPPLASHTQPYSSLPALTAFLRTNGRHEVTQFDANIEFTREILTSDAIRAAAERLAERTHRPETDSSPPLSAHESDLLITAVLKAPIVTDSIDRVVSDLKNPETFRDLERLDKAKRLIHDAFEVISASWFPVSLSATDPSQAAPYSWAQLDRWARDRRANPFRSFLEERFFPKVLRAAPGAIGLSITYESQLLAAVTLCTILRERLPKTPVVLGGHIVSSWYECIEQCPQVFEWCDFLVAFEGESALEALLSGLESGGSLDQVPNLVYRRRERVVRNPCAVENINALSTPDYRGLPLDLYLAPETVFLLNTSRGCYWSKCTFCSVSPSMRGSHRARRPGLVVRDIETIIARHSSRCIMFGDDCVPPPTLAALARDPTLARTGISWQCEARFEPSLTCELLQSIARAGCRNLTFGLESYAPRILSLMNKGVPHQEIRRILDDCRQSGIAFNLQLFFGFPGESEQDARQTIDFVLDEMRGAATCSFGLFRLLRGSNVGRHPEAFGIHLLESASSIPCERMEYAPLPEHAAEARLRLRREMLRRTRHRYAAFSLDAHTLLFLHHAGVEKMARDYYSPFEPDGIAGPNGEPTVTLPPRLVRKANQVIVALPQVERNGEHSSRILVYDYDLDEAIEVSRLAVWVLQQFDAPKPASEPGLQAAQAAANPTEGLRVSATVNGVVADLFKRRLLVTSSRAE